MRIDSCRACGQIMQELQSCPECKRTVQFVCPSCKKPGEAQIHVECSTLGTVTVTN